MYLFKNAQDNSNTTVGRVHPAGVITREQKSISRERIRFKHRHLLSQPCDVKIFRSHSHNSNPLHVATGRPAFWTGEISPRSPGGPRNRKPRRRRPIAGLVTTLSGRRSPRPPVVVATETAAAATRSWPRQYPPPVARHGKPVQRARVGNGREKNNRTHDSQQSCVFVGARSTSRRFSNFFFFFIFLYKNVVKTNPRFSLFVFRFAPNRFARVYTSIV